MRSRGRILLLPLLTLLASLVAGHAALATTTYPNYLGTSVNFTGIQETSTFGDPEPACCFGAPTGVGDQLLFFPTNFTATTTGVNGFDQTGSQLQATITAVGGAKITTILLSEFGDATLSGAASANTGVFANMAGFITVLEVNGVSVAPTVIGFNAGGLVNGSFTPGTLGTTGLDRNTNPGTTLWNGQVAVNIASVVANATKVTLSFDNDLSAYTEFASNAAKIQKKVVDGPAVIITVVPEPGTLVLLSGGLLAMAIRARSRRA
jgi:hypothetical protein